jgi:hypothetical protein
LYAGQALGFACSSARVAQAHDVRGAHLRRHQALRFEALREPAEIFRPGAVPEGNQPQSGRALRELSGAFGVALGVKDQNVDPSVGYNMQVIRKSSKHLPILSPRLRCR